MLRSKLAHAVRRCLWTTVSWTFVLIATNGTMRSESPSRKIVGPGATPCQRFNADIATNPASRRDYLAWAQGYMTGLNKSSTAPKNLRGWRLEQQRQHIRAFCDKRPLAMIGDAVDDLFTNLPGR